MRWGVSTCPRCARVDLSGKWLEAALGPQGAAKRDNDDVFTLEELALEIDGA